MKKIFISIFLYFTIHSLFSQDTCFTSIKYGSNSKVGKFAKVNGIKMYYEMYGDVAKQPLLLIHGNGGSIFSERCQIEHFKNQYRVIIADSRFQGKTEDGAEVLTYDLMAKDYNALLDYLKIDSAYIIGQSDGGIIGLLLAMNYPKKVKKLVSTAPNLRADSTALALWAIELTRNDIKKVKDQMNKGDTSQKLIRELATQNLLDTYPNINSRELSKIKVPVLVMAADADVIKLEHILEIYQNIPKAQLFIMPGATHFMLRSNYSLFNQIVGNFLNKPFTRPTTKEVILK